MDVQIGMIVNAETRSRELERMIAITREFSPLQLKLARELAGLDIKELAERIETSSSAVSQFEKGTSRPKLETAIRLALALGVPPEFLAGESLDPIKPEGCHFRSQRSVTAKERRRVLAYGAVCNSLARYLEARVNFPDENISMARSTTESFGDAESIAAAVRDLWGLGYGPISNMVGLLEAKGVLCLEIPGHSQKLDGFSTWIDSRPAIFLTTDKNSGSRRRFDAAHELGHLISHRDDLAGSAAVEREADAFASAFLLPTAPFVSECPKRLDWIKLRRLKQRWGVSLSAIVRRAYDLGIFSEATYRRAYVYLNSSGWRQHEPDEPAVEHPAMLQRAVALLYTAGYTTSNIAADLRVGAPMLEQILSPERTLQDAVRCDTALE